MERVSGIYRIVCTTNGNYIYGSSDNVWKRWVIHKSRLRCNRHDNPIAQNTWNKYGEASFRIELIEEVSPEELLKTEDVYIKKYHGTPHCMNIAVDASSPGRGRKMGPRSDEVKLKLRLANLGKHHSEETKKKIADSHRGKIVSETTRDKLRISNLGKQHSKESKEKMRNNHLGKTASEKTKLLMSNSHIGINTWAKGRKMSIEERQIRSLAQKRRYTKHIESNP